jgi:hypothetical protein
LFFFSSLFLFLSCVSCLILLVFLPCLAIMLAVAPRVAGLVLPCLVLLHAVC